MKSWSIIILLVGILGCIVLGVVNTEAVDGDISPEKAKSIVEAFVGEERAAQGVQLLKLGTRGTYPPFEPIYIFKCPTGVTDSSGKPLAVAVFIEQKTGRIVRYSPDLGYDTARNSGKAKHEEADMLTKASATDIAKGILSRANIDHSSMRLQKHDVCWFGPRVEHEALFRSYVFHYTQVQSLADGTEIELPKTVTLKLDAVTGELHLLLLKEWPVTIPLSTPKLTEQQAIEIAKAQKLLKDGTTSVEGASLEVVFNTKGLTEEQHRLEDTDAVRFYDEVQKPRQVLAWRVTLKGTAPISLFTGQAKVWLDANTGEVFSTTVGPLPEPIP